MTNKGNEESIGIFISYARKDRRWFDVDDPHNLIPWLMDSLRKQNVIFWYDRELVASDLFTQRIHEEIDRAHIAVLMVSQSFLNSDYIEKHELPWIKQRVEQGGLAVVPVLVEPCSWEEDDFLSARQILPGKPTPLIKYVGSDALWADVKYELLEGIKKLIRRIRAEQERLRGQLPVLPEVIKAPLTAGVTQPRGAGETKDSADAVKWRKLAENGTPWAQYNLGVCYAVGQGVARNAEEAINWYRKAAEQGNANAQYSLGECYDDGKGVKRDEAEAVVWYRKAAEQGDPLAQIKLGGAYSNGIGRAKDMAEAVKWFRKTADQGYPTSQCFLGACYRNGEGVAKDEAEAVRWYRKAADQGSAEARAALDPSHVGNSLPDRKVARNDPCPCGSGKKFKECHGR